MKNVATGLKLPTRATRWPLAVAVVLVTSLAFLPSLRNDFVNWDDPSNIIENRNIRGLTWPHVRWMFTTFHLGPYQPLSWLSLALDYSVWGLDPFGIHLTSLLLHAGASLGFFAVSRRLLRLALRPKAEDAAMMFAAALSAIVFSIHPLRVESVAWATERRDVLSGLFCVWAVWAYLSANEGRESGSRSRGGWMAISFALFLSSLLAKASAVALPVVLVVLDVYPLRRLNGSFSDWFTAARRLLWLEKLPFLAVSVIIGLLAIHGQRVAGAFSGLTNLGLADRALVALYASTFYVTKTVLPVRLSPLYELPRAADHWTAWYVLGGVLAVAISVALFALRRRWPAAFAVWLSYLVLLAPVSGLAQSGAQIAADRYSYVPCLGFALLAGGAVLNFGRAREGKRFSLTAPIVATALAASVLVPLTWIETRVWRNSETLWRHALALDRSSSMAYSYLARAMIEANRLDEARSLFERAIELRPENADAHNNLGVVLRRVGEPRAAFGHYAAALRLRPGSTEFADNLALLLTDPNLVSSDEFATVEDQWRAAARLFERTLAADPDRIDALNGLGIVSKRLGQPDRAVSLYRRALELEPGHASASHNLALLLEASGKFSEARRFLSDALRRSPDHPLLLYHLSWLLATAPQAEARDGRDAVRLAERLRDITRGSDPQALDALAAAYAEVGRFADAITVAELASRLARERNSTDLAGEIEARISLYRSARPFRSRP